MNRHISGIITHLFEKVPYSAASDQAREKIAAHFEEAYREGLHSGSTEVQSLGTVMQQYGTLTDAAALIGLDADAAKALADPADAITEKQYRRRFLKVRICSALAAMLVTFMVYNIGQGIYFLAPSFLIFPLLCAGLLFGIRQLCRKDFQSTAYDAIRLTPEAKARHTIYLDRYTKRTVNSFFLFIGGAALFLTTVIACVIQGDMNREELAAMFLSNLMIPAGTLWYALKNVLQLIYLDRSTAPKQRSGIKRYVGIAAAVCGGFLLLSAGIFAIAAQFVVNAFNYYYIAVGCFILIAAAVNLKLRQRVVEQNFRFNGRRLAVFTAAAVVLLTINTMRKDVYMLTPYIMRVSAVPHTQHAISYDDATGVYTIEADEGDFKILHLTDIHIGGSVSSTYKDYKALHACYALIEHTQPDFVVVTGDLVFPMALFSLSLNNQSPVTQFASFMRNTGIPWAFTYGNHDTESMATGNREDIASLYRSLSYKTSGNLLYPYTQPEITGRCNQMIRIANKDGSVRQALFLIDSNDYTGEGINTYDYIHDDQVEWYAEQVRALNETQGKVVPSMLFFHIPLQQYRTAYELYQQNSSEVTYHFGKIGETMIDAVCCSNYPSKLFDTAVELGSTQAMFCGHDHYNNISLTYKGIRLTYGMSIDYLAMPHIDRDTEQRGAELITLHPDGGYALEQIPLTSLQ